jgi:hypothetical protein
MSVMLGSGIGDVVVWIGATCFRIWYLPMAAKPQMKYTLDAWYMVGNAIPDGTVYS